MESNKTNLKAVKELVLDEHKLVTYISLSKELCIHVNEAKSLLCELIQNTRKAHPETDLNVSYVISGLLNDNNGCLSVCSEKDLETLKKTLKVIFYEHVYCVSRGPKFVDTVALTAINKFEDLPLCIGLIKASSCSKRTEDEIGDLKSKNRAVLNIPKSTLKKSVQQNPKDKVKEVRKHEVKSLSESKLAPNTESEIPSPKKDITNNHKTATRPSNNKIATKGIAGFFSKVNGDSSKAKQAKVHAPEIKVEKDIKVEPTSTDTNISAETNASLKNIKTKANNNNSLTKIKNNSKVDKKRKRLLHVSDSESETEENDPFSSNEMEVNHESEDEIPPTPTINTVTITSGIVNPRKRRKIVDKTYTDEDGYILTKKEEVYESISENEEEIKENGKQEKESGKQDKQNGKQDKQNGKQEKENIEQLKLIKNELSPKENKGKKKVSPPKKGKQPTINNFFKKI